jgi:multidrug efflux pump subunit AcrA (membrane-fusion protein)
MPEPRPPRPWAVYVFLAVAFGGAAWLAALQRSEPKAGPAPKRLRTAVVERGTLEVRLRLMGNVTAQRFYNVVVPKLRMPEPDRPLTLLRLAASGQHVRRGEVIAEFDSLSARDHMDDTRDEFHNRQNLVARQRALMDVEIGRLSLQIRRAKAQMDKARLDMKTAPVRSGIQREVFRLAAEEADATYQSLEEQLELRVESQSAALSMWRLSEEMARMHVERHEDDIARMTIHSPSDGMVVVRTQTRHDGEQWTLAAGDRVSPGAALLQVVDRASMQVDGSFNQVDSRRFRVGQEATIRLEAIPGAQYRGKVYSVGALATVPGRTQPFLRNIPIRLQILDPDERLLPHLTASADITVERDEDVLLAPSEALHEENGQTYVLVQTPGGVERRAVTKRRVHGSRAALSDGVAEGDVVVLE